ncbi:MAG: hypothetical protein QME72_01920 [Rhodococcus sp. (in: high G+C Gram-positive bacteria)]|nr:hypothetical protein [Rhodococcus sp. (in: high G+C Gram-positive bacteria)]MDI6626460.1 hypothetical protein [Rhodococcus sp. (in: high G+C Gram-positive bacteria)]
MLATVIEPPPDAIGKVISPVNGSNALEANGSHDPDSVTCPDLRCGVWIVAATTANLVTAL